MGYFTRKDLQVEVDRLNKKYKRTDKSPTKFTIDGAYGGHQIVLRENHQAGFGSGVKSVTHGFQSAKETAFDLYKIESRGLSQDVKRMDSYAREQKRHNKKKR